MARLPTLRGAGTGHVAMVREAMGERRFQRVGCVAMLLAGCGSPGDVARDTQAEDTANVEEAQVPEVATDVADAEQADATAPDVVPSAMLERWLVGDPGDATTVALPGLVLAGGGADVDLAMAWQRDRSGGGDVVVLRASGADGYNDYLLDEIGGVDSVETLLLDRRERADEPYVAWALARAEVIFIAGGDQSVYLDAWRGTPVEAALVAARGRGVVLGGTSAGAAVLGAVAYSAARGTVYSDEALADPYHRRLTLEPGLGSPAATVTVITDTHFAERDRMGRLIAFVARAMLEHGLARPLGIGIDEGTALLVDEAGLGVVVGSGSVYVIAPVHAPERCVPGEALTWRDVPVHELHAGDAIRLPDGVTAVAPRLVTASGGALSPTDPY